MNWQYSGSVLKSSGELDRLVNNVLLAPDYDKEDLRGFRASTELNRMDTQPSKATSAPADGWREVSVRIPLPKARECHESEATAPFFEVKNIFIRPLLQSIKAAYEDVSAARLHYMPFHLFSQGTCSFFYML